ncbi:MAG: TniQ family protein [Desulfuromonadaceae bacterium]|nr:TniQ family protein [Desulfuromonadaceae bacterium]
MSHALDTEYAGNRDPYLYDFIPVRAENAQEPTVLYGLEPIGIGTALVESLSSYLARLAAAHMLPVSALLRDVVAIHLPNDDHNLEKHIGPQRIVKNMNGMAPVTSNLVGVVEKLTGRTNLSALTMIPFSKVVSPYRLMSSESFWCPYCLEEQKTSGTPVYFPLLWSLNHLKKCTLHRCPLTSVCPHCHEASSVIASRTVVGFCPFCHNWLGAKTKSRIKKIDCNNFFVRFFEWRNKTDLSQYEHTFPSMLKYLIGNKLKKADVATLARLLHLSDSIVHELLSGKMLPAVGVSFWISKVFRIDPMDLLTVSEKEMSHRDVLAIANVADSILSSHTTDWTQLQGLLKDVASGKASPMRLEDIARVYKCTLGEMTSIYPEFCSNVTKRLNRLM